MVPALRLATLCASSAMLPLLAANVEQRPAADDSLVCVNATRDWSETSGRWSLEAARAFLISRVKPECPALARSVRGRILALESARTRENRAASAAPRREAPRTRPSRPPSSGRATAPEAAPSRRPADTSAVRDQPYRAPPRPMPEIRRRPPLTLNPTRVFQFRYPNWGEVVNRFPQLEQLYNRGGADLCARCIVGASGFLEDCEVAGAAAADRTIREGAKRMMSLIHIARQDGTSAAGALVAIPVQFGRRLSPPPGGYCSSPEAEFRP